MNIQDIKQLISNVYEKVKTNDDGYIATYIPELARVDPSLFGISVCFLNGETFDIGDRYPFFCLQSCSKPFNYCLARMLCDKSNINVHDYVGYEPSGRSFNSFTLNNTGLPHNPMLNAGSIMVNSLILPTESQASRFRTVQDYYDRLCHQRVRYDNAVYLSEKEHCDRNMSLCYYMRENKAFRSNPSHNEITDTLNLYFQSCSVSINTRMGAMMASTLANKGINPITHENIIPSNVIQDCLSLMFSSGLYDYSGQFAFEIGLPAKSGVSGCMLLVIPNVCGICIYSPRLDNHGNSVRAMAFCREFATATNNAYHIFCTERNDKINTACNDKQDKNHHTIHRTFKLPPVAHSTPRVI